MRFVRDAKTFSSLPAFREPIVNDSIVGVCIGNFDGFHRGHQQLFRTLEDSLSSLTRAQGKLPLKVLLTFEPHPKRVISELSIGETLSRPEYWRLTSIRKKIELASEFGFDYFFAARFSRGFSQLAPKTFVERILRNPLSPKIVVVGEDWSFGKNRGGNVELLSNMGLEMGFQVLAVSPVLWEGKKISSTMVKDALGAGDLKRVRVLLGRNFSLSGKVRKGTARGRKLGFRTANMRFYCQVLPRDGVYATYAELDGEKIPSVSNVGVRPTFGAGERLVETHLLIDGGRELLSKNISVEFVERIRDEICFPSEDQLRAQIEKDVKRARDVLS
ncbi:MAG: riboflavin biosynthesis protein RibF [Deltaproteobacteria bacterium]|nr:riboflavin biosynthesis protein RibF [Deltaproteobacteria bacterium]